MASSLLLLLTAALWGFAFVAQRQGMQSLDAFSFNALRFAWGPSSYGGSSSETSM
jgi:drug/metabolite transporter (DMT)-like permease